MTSYVVQPYNKSIIQDIFINARIVDVEVGDDCLLLVVEKDEKLKQIRIEVDETRDPRHEAVLFISSEDI